MSKANIIISAGGTGGHIFPALAVAAELNQNYNIEWVGATSGLEDQLVPAHGYPLSRVTVAGVRNKGWLRKLMLPFTMLRALGQCLVILRATRPRAVIGFGGYATFPICLSARLLAIPVLIHEQNSVAGLTNRVLAKLAKRVLVAFPGVLPSGRTQVVGNPVRQEILCLRDMQRPTAAADKLRVLIIGGSLGAKALNETLPPALALCGERIASVVHQVGRNQQAVVMANYQAAGVKAQVVEFIDDMAGAYANADLIICRAGASTVAEVACAGLAAIFVPYPYAVDDHQTANANFLVKLGGAWLLPQAQMTAVSLAKLIGGIGLVECQARAAIAREAAICDSTSRICQQVHELLN